MKRKIAILLAILMLCTLMTSCDKILSKIPGLGGDQPKGDPKIFVVTYVVDDYRISIDQVTEGFAINRPEDPTRDGYAFEGWYADEACTKEYDFSSIPSGDVKLWAKWRQTSPTPGTGGSDKPLHNCESVCPQCGGCLDASCTESACTSKCAGHTPPHECESKCEECSKCLDAACSESACEGKCEGHHECESVCDKCGKCADGECAEDVCKEKCEGHTVEVKNTTIYLVGDSTVCSFTDDYYYPRYGWGTQLGGYLTDKATVVNLALSGRSSKSFTTEANYQTLINSLKAGDYLLIAFGHNDEKSDDETRFTDASLPYTNEASFGYYLYTYYVKLAEEKGATPILVTPIVRAKSNDDYSGNEGHVTATGDYRQAIIDLGEAVGVDVIDMTSITRARYEELGYDEAIKYHAVLQGKKDGEAVVENWNTVDKTHLNIYGAKYVAYKIADELMKLDGIMNYVAEGITEPTEADRVPNASYVVPDYLAPDLDNYTAPSHFSTMTDGWYGTAFGDTGGNPQSTSNGYYATETSEGVFKVGNDKGKGKFASGSDGFAFLFTQVEANKNFKISVTGKVLQTATTKQAGFGLMLRDDCVIDQNAAGTIATNYLTAGIYANSDSQMYANFYRENASFKKGEEMTGMYAVGDVVTFTIERIGQTVHVTVVYNGVTYTESYYDFDLFARDGEYMYVGMFANRGTVVEFTNLNFEITGESQGA